MFRKSQAHKFSGIILAIAVLALSVGISRRATAAPDAVHTDKDNLKGTWALEAVRFGDAEAKDLEENEWGRDCKDLRMTFSETGVVVQSTTNPKALAEPYKLDPSRSPKELDIGRGLSLKEYIYKLQGDKLILAFSSGELVAGGTLAERQWQMRRPCDFKETKENAPPIIWILKRVKR
jgi:uncharacterized protein (TIGR03067 family)